MKKLQGNPGPGTYDQPGVKLQSFSISSKMTLPRRVRPSREAEQKLGPGFYSYEKTTNASLLSNNRKTLATKFSSPNERERLKFSITKYPGPGSYNYESKIDKISNHSAPSSHKISNTKRSDIVDRNSNLAPGYY